MIFLRPELKPRVLVKCPPGKLSLALQDLASREYTHPLVSFGFSQSSNAVGARFRR